MDRQIAMILAALETAHDTIFVGPACRETRLVAFSPGLCSMDTEQTVIDAPLAVLEMDLTELLRLHGWSVRSDGCGGYIARRRNSIATLAA